MPTDTYVVSCRDASLAPVVTMTRPDLTFFTGQLAYVQSWAEIRDERSARKSLPRLTISLRSLQPSAA